MVFVSMAGERKLLQMEAVSNCGEERNILQHGHFSALPTGMCGEFLGFR